MKLNSHVVFLIVIVGIITAGVVGASIMNNGSMKQVDFDGVKVSVPSNAEFIKTGDGYADSKYGITIHVFKNNDSMVNYLKGINGASIVALKNQPPQSVAYVYGDDTNVLITNSVEGISIGAKDQALVADMANSVVFSNHQKSAKPHVSIPGIAPPPHLEFNTDFNFMALILAQVNTEVFNAELYQSNLSMTINEYNDNSDQGTLDQYTANEYVSNVTSDSAVVNNADNSQPQTSLLDNPAVSTIVESVSSGDGAASGDVASSDGAVSSGSGSVSAPSSGGSAPASSDTGSSSDGGLEKLTKKELEEEVLMPILEKEDCTIDDIDDKGDYYLVTFKYSSGHVEKVKYDAYTGQELP